MPRDNYRGNKERRERDKASRAAKKRARKRAKAERQERIAAGDDPDLAGIVVGPQPKDKPSEAEVARAVELAMNPQAQHANAKPEPASTSKLFVGNLDFGINERELTQLFVDAGYQVQSASIPLDRDSGRSRGFAFVELADGQQAAEANERFDGYEFHGRALRVNEANDR